MRWRGGGPHAGRAGPGAGVRAANHYLAAVPTPAGAVVSGYWAIRDEIDAMPLLARLVGAGLRLLPAGGGGQGQGAPVSGLDAGGPQ